MKGLALRRPARRGVRKLLALAALPTALALPAYATTFTDSEFVTWSQVAWGDTPAPGNISFSLEENFNSVFAPSDLLQVGIPRAGGFSMIFDSADAIIAYLPSDGAPGMLTVTLDDPVTTAAGSLGGEVVTAALNVAFSDDDLLPHPPGIPFGNLVLQNLSSLPGVGPEIAELDGTSVRQVLAAANLVLGGGSSPFTPIDMFTILNDIDMSFNGGPVSVFAMEYLGFPSTPPVPEPSTWAMLLIGFAGLGFVGWRARRSHGAAG